MESEDLLISPQDLYRAAVQSTDKLRQSYGIAPLPAWEELAPVYRLFIVNLAAWINQRYAGRVEAFVMELAG